MAEQISSYRLESEIARGGMGIVYRAVHTVFEEVVAIKAIFPELTLNPELRTRFVNEAKIQRRLQHPNIVQIREFLIIEGRFYIVMELIEGETLAECLRRLGAPLPANEALEIFRQALQGLGFAHAQGVIHRDMKPSNIMLTREGAAKLTDFGIARAVGVAGLTRTGTVLGTPAYMAPEQIQGHQVDQRADIYSLGVTLYEMVTGRVPFEKPKDSDSDYQVLRAHIEEPPPQPTRFVPTIPPFVEGAILRAMAKRPDERFASCEAFEAALVPPELPPTRRVVAATPPGLRVSEAPVAPGAAALRPASVEAARPRVAPGPPAPLRVAKPVAPQRAPAKMMTRRRYLWAVLVLAVALGVYRYFFYRSDDASKQTLSGHEATVQSVAFSPDGRLLASGSLDKTIKLWDVARGAVKQTLSGHRVSVNSVAFSPDGRLLASGGGDATIKLWDVVSGALWRTLMGDGFRPYSVAFSPDGRLLASGGEDWTIELWDVASGVLGQTLSGHYSVVYSVAFSPDGRTLASGSADSTIKLWECVQ